MQRATLLPTSILSNTISISIFSTLDINPAGDPNGLYFLNLDTSPFAPPDLAPGQSAVNTELFTFDVAADTPVGTYADWTYDVFDASGDFVSSGTFDVIVDAAVTTVPEPVSLGLSGHRDLVVLAAYRRRFRPLSGPVVGQPGPG